MKVDRTSWLAVRVFREDGGRVRFAHTAPWRFQVDSQPMQPRRQEIEFLIERVRSEIERNRSVLAPNALAEFEKALAIYEKIATRAVSNKTP